eukprot:743025-Pyramimonas_sp.AAC.1
MHLTPEVALDADAGHAGEAGLVDAGVEAVLKDAQLVLESVVLVQIHPALGLGPLGLGPLGFVV